MRPRLRRFLSACLVLGLAGGAAAAWAQPAPELLNAGQYMRARAAFAENLVADAGGAIEGYFETFLQTGDFYEGLAAAERRRTQWPGNAFVLYAEGRLLRAVGRIQEAEQALIGAIQAKSDYWRAGLELADLFAYTGQQRRARGLYSTLSNNLRQGIFTSAADMAVGAQAAARLEEYHDANEALTTALRLEPGNVQHLLWHGDLYRVTYDVAQAQTLYEEALTVNPHRAALYVALAQTAGSYARKEELAREALKRMPRSVPARSLLALLHILDGELLAAEAQLTEALAINPNAITSLARLATVHHLRGDSAAYAAVEARTRQINSTPSDYYLAISEGLTLRFRYPAAAAMARKAVEADPVSAAANAALGTALLRLGDARQARRYLDRAYERDAFNLFVANTLSLLDETEAFTELESAHIRLRIHRSEADVLGPAMLREAEDAYQAMVQRYPYRPAGKILIEAYNDADDFAVRVAGVPHVGLLGVSFGDVLAINTPEAQGDRPYNWARTLWHEIAHTMAIGTSAFHVPRWLTEGLSVYEEQRAYPEWTREYELRFFMALDRDRLHPLEEIDRGFTRPAFPGQVMMSYYHAYKVVDFMVAQHGFEAIAGLLGSLRAGRSMEQAVQEVLGMSVAQLDDAFHRSLRARRAALGSVLQGWPDMLTEEASGSSLEEWLRQQGKNSLLGALQEGADALAQSDDEEAEARFKEALEIYPYYTSAGNAYQGLAAIYRQRGDEQALVAILEAFLAVTPFGAAEARELSAVYAKRGDLSRARALLIRSRTSAPYNEDALSQIAQLSARQGDYALEVEARRALLALGPADQAAAYFHLAQSLYNNAEIAQAKRAVLQSLEIAPGFREAQALLLECVGEGR